MAIETNLGSIQDNGGDKFVRRDKSLIREALEETEFQYDGIIWTTKEEGLDITLGLITNLILFFLLQFFHHSWKC